MSEIVVVVKSLTPSVSGTVEKIQYKEYKDADALNNERGELIIDRVKIVKGTEHDEYPTYQRIDTIAVFKEWLYWEKKE